MEGTVKFFNRIKGFGFVSGDDGKEYFVHFSAVKDGKYLNEGDRVSFEPVEGEKGLKAEKVELLGKGEAPARRRAPKTEETPDEDEEPAEEFSEETDEDKEGDEEE